MMVGSDVSSTEKERRAQSERRGLSDSMRATGSLTAVDVTIYFLCVIPIAVSYPAITVQQLAPPRKCCVVDYAFNEELECVYVDRLNYTTGKTQQADVVTVIASVVQGLNCRDFLRTSASSRYCVEKMTNGTSVLVKCPDAATTRSKMGATANASKENKRSGVRCVKGGLHAVIFWGAQTYMESNMAHMVLCIVVVTAYLSVPELGKSIYNRAVLRHNICLLAQGSILTFLVYHDLCECPITDDVVVFLWIAQQYFTNATGFWLNVICFDMTLSITRFRWTPGSGQRTSREENRRLLLYSCFVWGGALIPAVVALVLEYCPGIPQDFPLKPNYHRYRDGPNMIVNLYFFGIMLLTLFWNNVLFVYTTYKIIRIQRSTEIATRGRSTALRKKYFLFLQLYLLMGSPWFFGSLFACFNNLVILKVCRLIQPILWLLMLVGHKKLRRKFADRLCCCERRPEDNAGQLVNDVPFSHLFSRTT